MWCSGKCEGMPTNGSNRSATDGLGLTMAGLVLGFLVAGPAFTAAQSTITAREPPSNYKGYSGFRVFENASREVYYQEQTIAVVEIDKGRHLLNCELIEVYQPSERKSALFNLTRISKPREISFRNMLDLMERCHKLKTPKTLRKPRTWNDNFVGSTSILSGVIPGTKWCGAGDLAETYFDLGKEERIDKCCRTHDLCPIKVRAYSSRYNLTNESIYTKSHCNCDAAFHECLKRNNNPTANLMGTLYFNVLRVPCIQDQGSSRSFQMPTPF